MVGGSYLVKEMQKEYLTNGGILGDKGWGQSGGFKIDTGYIYTSSMDKTKSKLDKVIEDTELL